MGHQIVAEGDSSPADVFLTENSPAMTLVERAGLLAAVDPATRQQVPKDAAPSSNAWISIAARSTVLVYNTARLTKADLPKSLMDLKNPRKDRWGCAAGGGLPVDRGRDARRPGRTEDRRLARRAEGQRQDPAEQHRHDEVGQCRRDGLWRDLPLLLVPRPDRHQGGQRQHRPPLLPQRDPGAFVSLSWWWGSGSPTSRRRLSSS